MKIIEYLRIFNKKKKIKQDKYIYIKQYYLSMYRFYMLKLYEAGYIDDPTIFNERMIRRNILDLKISGITSEIGSFILTSDRVRYAYYKNKDENQREFLSLLYDALLYREYSNSIDNMFEAYGCGIMLQLRPEGGNIVTLQGIKLNKANLRVFVNENETLDRNDLNEYKLRKIFEIIGVEYKDYAIDKDLTCEELCEMLDVVFGDNPPKELDGEYADIVRGWFKTYNRTILSHLYSHYAMDLLEEVSNLANSLDLCDIVCISGTDIYTRRNIEYKNYPIGFFNVIGGFNGDTISEEEEVNGYTGEGYTKTYLEEEGFNYIGVPIVVNEEEVYDREQTTVISDSWFKDEGVVFYFENPTIEQVNSEIEAILSTKQGNLGVLKV